MNLKIVVSLLTNRQEFQLMQAEDARSAARRALFEVEVVFAESSVNTQIQQLSSFVSAPPATRPAAFIVEAVKADGLERAAREATRAGISWILLSSNPPYLTDLVSEYPKLSISAIADDNDGIGRIQAQQVRVLLPKGGQIVLLEGPGGSAPMIHRRQSLETGLRDSKTTILKELGADWTEEGAERVVSNWLRLKPSSRPDLLVSQNDSMAAGARKAILALRQDWGSIPMIGCDGLVGEGQRMVKEKLLIATVVKPTTTGKAIELFSSAIRGQGAMPPFMYLPVQSYPPLEELATRR